MSDAAQAEEVTQSLFGERRTLFGGFALGTDANRTVTIPDAVRRCRWIAVDINASSFTLLFAGPSAERYALAPCFDSSYPDMSEETKSIVGDDCSAMAKHAQASSVPCWWDDLPGSASSASFAALGWTAKIEPVVAGTSGIVFPVHAEHGRCGVVIFFGSEIALAAEGMFDIHARCFSLFDAVARMRPGENAKFPSISKRELECLKLTANGYTSDEIARLLKLSVHTANQYLTNTTQKLDAVNRMHAVAKALRMGLIE
ncbi:MAG: helix-turn-helix transcriptional regulator [Pseudomonadota bacterium]|nr:helix-turn-helix transcriptional regulator [Pseudomonadota bacterium]